MTTPRSTLHIPYVVLFLVIVVVATSGQVSDATIVLFTSESTFLEAAPIVSTMTFDSYAGDTSFGLGSAALDEVVYERSELAEDWRIRELQSLLPPSPPNVFGTRLLDAHTRLSFGDGRSCEAIGFYMFHQLASPLPMWDITVRNEAGATLVVPVAFDSPGFFGFASTDGIVSVEIDDNPNDGRVTNFWFDNVSRSAVIPEPSTIALLAMGAVGMLVYWRRKRNRD